MTAVYEYVIMADLWYRYFDLLTEDEAIKRFCGLTCYATLKQYIHVKTERISAENSDFACIYLLDKTSKKCLIGIMKACVYLKS